LAKLRSTVWCLVFLTHSVDVTRSHIISKIDAVVRYGSIIAGMTPLELHQVLWCENAWECLGYNPPARHAVKVSCFALYTEARQNTCTPV